MHFYKLKKRQAIEVFFGMIKRCVVWCRLPSLLPLPPCLAPGGVGTIANSCLVGYSVVYPTLYVCMRVRSTIFASHLGFKRRHLHLFPAKAPLIHPEFSMHYVVLRSVLHYTTEGGAFQMSSGPPPPTRVQYPRRHLFTAFLVGYGEKRPPFGSRDHSVQCRLLAGTLFSSQDPSSRKLSYVILPRKI